ncbi:M56 family metallopeptidase [Zobellia alginiliquefaciens]|uniref:M56 family metallopeptidase n=1 Tax=Zobellia alginiliquefaciens TaxID=3032586 RepID=UPI0023E3AE26|nr:M56 family metallopeptidase [Zobellia alginiliquefaciens]
MVQYVLECIAFQLVFLVIYDFFLKRETFFQWNRFYLLSTFLLSLLLPFVKIEAFKTTVNQPYIEYGEALWGVDNAVAISPQETSGFDISWQAILFGLGALVSTVLLGYKLRQLYVLKAKGDKISFKEFTQILIPNSNMAFSFFKSIFIGDKVSKADYTNIIAHELVHIKQGHSWDLLFFELMRIIGWFNPLVYVYQNRISELHEFIADAKVAKNNKNEQYQLLLSQVFQTHNISFINHFFKSSLIKKRIVMLQKSQSKSVFKLKYLALVPVVFGILMYTSSEAQYGVNSQLGIEFQSGEDEVLIENAKAKIKEELKVKGSLKDVYLSHPNRSSIADSEGPLLSKEDYFEDAILFKMRMDEAFSEDVNYKNRIPVPSTKRYESYLKRKEAFQILDENLKFSIQSDKVEKGFDVVQIEDNSNVDNSYELHVNNVSDLSGEEIRYLNRSMEKVFAGNSKYRNLILSDNSRRFLIREVEPIVGINTFPKLGLSDSKKGLDIVVKEIPFAKVDLVPVFPGCENEDNKRECFKTKMMEHVGSHFSYPKEAQKKGVQGKVSVLLTISEEGLVKNIKTRGPNPLLEGEALRIFELLPQMAPGKHKNENVDVLFSMPISFKLQ